MGIMKMERALERKIENYIERKGREGNGLPCVSRQNSPLGSHELPEEFT